MKKILLVILIAFTSCAHEHIEFIKPTVILKKQISHTDARGWVQSQKYIYIFDGKDARWMECSDEIYTKYNEGDTIKSVVLKSE